MATVYYGIDVGQSAEDVAIDTATNGTDVEISVDTTKAVSTGDLLAALENLKIAILSNAYPFA